ncbi:AbrB/MazE/SpoVT family DNA-binding domain-containing protein [Candidatus Woesearchaeota archaeon]|nr:AbrB/MazE/SpoVT family DNA-binding domain-containing protein [Candidatus Woesearchaeota archaeon]
MRRKIIKQGYNTLTISLPIKWAKRLNLKGGDEISITEEENELVIRAKGKKVPRKAVLDIRYLGLMSRRSLAALYKSGYDEVEIIFSDPKQLKPIEGAVDLECMTYEIVKVTKDKCYIKNISEPSDKEFDSLLRRTVYLLKTSIDDLEEAIKEKDYARIEHIQGLEKVNNKFTHFCRRALNTIGYSDAKKAPAMYTIVEQLENVADEFKFLCMDIVANKKDNISKKTISLLQDVKNSIDLYTKIFFNYTPEQGEKFAKQRKDIVKKGHDLLKLKTNSYTDTLLIMHLITIEKQTFDILGPLLATVL